jgi:hypothetical protein
MEGGEVVEMTCGEDLWRGSVEEWDVVDGLVVCRRRTRRM